MTNPYADGVLWRGSASNPLAVAVAAVLGFAALTAPAAGQWIAALVALGGAAFSITYSRLDLTIDRDRVTIALGPWRWPRHEHAISEIEWVEYASITRQQARIGIGRRGSRKRLEGEAILLRPGDAIRFQMKGGIRHRVTVDGALGAVSVLERLVGAQD